MNQVETNFGHFIWKTKKESCQRILKRMNFTM